MSGEGRAVLSLAVSEIRPETADAVTVVFGGDGGRVGGSAGQYLIVRTVIGGEEHRRVFSLSSTPELGQAPSITVKRVPGGLVSGYFAEQAGAGDPVGVEPPAGEFTVGIDPANRRTYYGFAAGSGIVPVMSILRGVLALEPQSAVRLAYGNRRPEDVIFAAELEELAAAHPGRLTVVHAISGRGSRIDRRFVDRFLVEYPPATGDVRYLLCGPPGMNRVVEARLRTLGVADDRLLVERYLPPARDEVPEPCDGALVRMEGGPPSRAAAGESLLDALDRTAAPVFYACRSGVCGTCLARLVSGRVDQGVPFALTEEEQRSGLVLTCVSRPLSPEVVLRPADRP